MPIKLKVYVNEDDALLFWSIPKPIPECRGFAIQRRIKRRGKKKAEEDFLLNRTGFANDNKNAKGPKTRPSTEWPFQRFSWTDHDAGTGDTISYRVIPMIRNSAGALEQNESQASAWISYNFPRVVTRAQRQPYELVETKPFGSGDFNRSVQHGCVFE